MSSREQGDYFERLALYYLKHDAVMLQQYKNPKLFSEWAREQGKDAQDTGIDIVAEIVDEEGYCAVQCKFRKKGSAIGRAELDSFLAASATPDFTRRLIIDTTEIEWGKNAEAILAAQEKPVNRITLSRLENSDIDWSTALGSKPGKKEERKRPRLDQKEAIDAVLSGFKKADRGKLILPCGTGKTYTSLKIAEKMAAKGGAVLFLVPSLALMSQTIRAWAQDATIRQRCFAVCSDVKVDSRRKNNDDIAEIMAHDLEYPATTDAAKLAGKAKKLPNDRMTVVFATYQSLQVIGDAQKKHGLWEFDLIICDEAHRTTGAILEGKEESNFVKIHDQRHIRGAKRLYMTATPRVFGDAAKSKANDAAVELCSMDDESLFGPVFCRRKFGWAVNKGLLADYKVIVLGVDEGMISRRLQDILADESSEIKLDDGNKIIGCYRALSKLDKEEFGNDTSSPMHSALAFCQDIKSSKIMAKEFAKIVDKYHETDPKDSAPPPC